MIRTIDFNALSTGENVTDQYSDIGLRISAVANGTGADQAMIFDTNNPTGGDEDLATDNLDNVLVISEDGDATDPNDNATGGTFTFNFDDPVKIKSLTFLDLEEPARLFFYDAAGNLLSEQFVPATPDNGQSVVQLAVEGATRFEVVMTGSGGFVEVEGTAEGAVFERDQLNTLLDLAAGGIAAIVAVQRETVATPPPARLARPEPG